jgi:hypothetical protein
MHLICLLAACAVSEPGYLSQRHFVVHEPFQDVVVRLTPEKNQRQVYLACDADLTSVEHETLQVFPLPLRIGRRVRFCLRLPLCQTRLESAERIEVSGKKMTVRCRLARANWKVRRLNVLIVLRRDGEQSTRVSTYATFEVNGLGQRLGWLLSEVTLERLECGLRTASSRPSPR